MGRLLGFAAGAASAVSQKRLDRHDLSLTHWVILTALWRADGLHINQIADYYKVKSPAASRIIDRMIERGLVDRRADPEDRRAARVYLTDKGRDLAHLIDFYVEVNGVLLKGFTKAEQKQFADYLERLIANAQDDLGGEAPVATLRT